jgi:hypothetical protein
MVVAIVGFWHFITLLKARPDIGPLFEAVKVHDKFTSVVFEHFMRTMVSM